MFSFGCVKTECLDLSPHPVFDVDRRGRCPRAATGRQPGLPVDAGLGGFWARVYIVVLFTKLLILSAAASHRRQSSPPLQTCPRGPKVL